MDPIQIAGAIAAIAAGTAGSAYLARGIWRGSRSLHRLAEGLLGDKSSGKLGVVERLDGIDRRLAAVEHQVCPNGGKSLHDKVNQIKQAVA